MNINNINDIQKAIQYGIIPISDACVQEIENMKRKEYLSMHPYSINLGKDGYWHTYLPKANGTRRAVKKKNYEDIEDVVIQFWKQNTTTTFKQRYDIWMDRQKQIGRSDNTIQKYRSDYKRFFEGDIIENEDIKNIDDEYLCSFIERLLKRRSIPYRALKDMFGYINGVFNKSIKDKLIKENPCIFIDLPIYRKYCRQPKPMVAQERTLSKQEKQSLLHKLEESYIKKPDYIVPYAVEFNLYTGMRVGELSALKWEDIDYENNLIYVRRSEKYNRSTKQYYISSTKTGKARAVPLTKESIDVLNRVKKAELKYGYLSDYVFSNKNGRIHTRLISGCARIRTTGDEFYNTKSIHAIRRTFNSELRCNGVSGTVASSIVGNTEKTNDEYYTYDVSDMQYKMAIVSKINKETATA